MNHLSYLQARLPSKRVAKVIPEILPQLKSFGRKSLQEWHDKMSQHNALLRRGMSMGLCRKFNAARLVHCSLDIYMLQMHADQIARALECYVSFGRRLKPTIDSDPDAKVWAISPDLSIQRRHWFQLSRRVMNLIRLIGIQVPSRAGDSKGSHATRSSPSFPSMPWLDDHGLIIASKSASDIFGDFGKADLYQPSISHIYGFDAEIVAT
jgi:hypothetical protein